MRFALAFLVIFLAACTQVSVHKPVEETEISAAAKAKLTEARNLIKANNLKAAVAKLSELNDNTLTPIEKALKYNLKGVILFNMNEVDKAILKVAMYMAINLGVGLSPQIHKLIGVE